MLEVLSITDQIHMRKAKFLVKIHDSHSGRCLLFDDNASREPMTITDINQQ